MGAKAAKIVDKDKGYRAMFERLRQEAASLTVGLHEGEGAQPKTSRDPEDASEATLLDIGIIHEFGLGVPRRSFIADWSDENRANHERQLRLMAKAVVTGKVKDMRQGLHRLGNLWVAEVQKRISDGIEPPLHPSTIKAKKSSKPLIDTGQLRTGIRFEIRSARGASAAGSGEDGGDAGGESGGDEAAE